MTRAKPKARASRTLCLVDGTALAYRSHYAFVRRPLTNSRGENVSAVYGFTSSLLKILEDFAPDLVAVVFDTPEPTFRHEAYEDYKATREAPPDEMIEQLPMIFEVVEALGVPIVELPGYEADDVIGTYALRAARVGTRCVIVSGDKDFFQLVREGVVVFDPGKGEEYDAEGVEAFFGVPPGQVRDVLGLMGDSSDNIPGVPGVGKKTAVSLVRQYGSIENVLSHIDEVGGAKRRENLTEYGDQALESRDLATIETRAPVELPLGKLLPRGVDVDRATELLRSLEFPSLLKRVVPLGGSVAVDYELVSGDRALRKLVGRLRRSGGFAVDLETTSLDPLSAEIVGAAFSVEAGGAYYVPIGHATSDALWGESALAVLVPLLEDPDIPKCGQNLKYDYSVLRARGVEMRNIEFDVMVASYLLDPGKRRHGLAALALEHLHRGVSSIESLIGKGKEQLSFADVSVEAARDYACEDAEVAFALAADLRKKVREAGLEELMRDLEMPLVPILARMELAGVGLDAGFLTSLGDELAGEIEKLRRRAFEAAGVEFNLDSPKQVGIVLFETLGLPKGRKTKTGYSTDIRVLSELCEHHEVPGLILEHRQLTKLKSGYLDALPKLVNPATGRVHTSFNQTVAATGRLSSSNPNLQNIPMRTELGRRIRKAFVAAPGRRLLSADYSQIELRIMAHLSGDATLGRAFAEGKDVHRSTAALIFGVHEASITKEQRDWAKTVNFGIMYGMSPYGLARELRIDPGEASEFIDVYFETYPGVREYTERAIDDALERGAATTILGRTRPIGGLDSENSRIRGLAERVAVNTPIQGSAADLIKAAMIAVDRRIERDSLPCDMVLQVHDELVFEVDEDAVDDVSAAITEEMESPPGFDLDVAIVVNTAHGADWYESH